MSSFFAVDTSNYTTSCAVYSDGEITQSKKLLPVKEGELGLRQSDAVYHHVQQLPQVSESLLKEYGNNITAIGVSSRPRDIEGSYMPCFSVGETCASMLSSALGVELYRFSHQAGHIASALYSCGRLDLLNEQFVAFHVSGGTTEAVLVTPDDDKIFNAEIISQSLDLKGGQAVDRVALMMGLKFPGGIELEKLALKWNEKIKVKPTMRGESFCLSGLENQCKTMLGNGEPCEKVARYCLETVSKALELSLLEIRKKYGNLPAVFAGGVMSNTIIKGNLTKAGDVYFAEPEFARDNAAGIAVLTSIKHKQTIDGEEP